MFSRADMEVRIWILLTLSLIIFSIVLDSRLPKIRIVNTKTRQDFIEIIRVFSGMPLLLTSYEGALIALHLKACGTFGIGLVFCEAVIGIMLIANRFIWYTAVCMLILQMGVVIQFGILPAVEYFVMVGIAVFLLSNNLRSPFLIEMHKTYLVDALRICTGISLVTLGFQRNC
jgi:hypothetical protein